MRVAFVTTRRILATLSGVSVRGAWMAVALLLVCFIDHNGICQDNLPPLHVAVGMRVSKGEVDPLLPDAKGKRVDIIWHHNKTEAKPMLLLENILVLDMELTMPMPANKEGKFVVILAVTQQAAQKIKLASEFGTLYVVPTKTAPAIEK